MGGLWSVLPRLSALTLFFAMATLGLPGLGNFMGEFLALLGAFKVNAALTAVAALALILAPVYALIIVQKICHGPTQIHQPLADGSIPELASLGLLVLALLGLGLHPQPVLDLTASPLMHLVRQVNRGKH